MNIGEELKKARESLAIDEHHVSDETHIRREYIIAFENNRPEDIKLNDVYKIGFLRIYSQYLRLNSNEIVAEYKKQYKIGNSGKNSAKNNTKKIISTPSEIYGAGIEQEMSSSAIVPEMGKPDMKKIALYGGTSLAILLVLIFGVWQLSSSPTPNPADTETTEVTEALPRAYQFEIISNSDQKVEIYENYNSETKKRGALVVNQHVPRNQKLRFTGRGTLYIREEVRGGITLILPKKSALDADTNTQVPFPLPALPAQRLERNCLRGTVWIQAPEN